MATGPNTPVRLSERRGSIGMVILLIVSLGLLAAQPSAGVAEQKADQPVAADANGGL